MVTRIKKSIQNSKRKGEFKRRQQQRIEKTHRKKNAERSEYVDKRDLLMKKKDLKMKKKDKKKKQSADKSKEENKKAEEDSDMVSEEDEELDQ